MDKFIIITSLATALLLVVAGGAIVYSSSNGATYSQEDALDIAKEFVMSEATFKYDGMSDTLTIKPGTVKAVDTYEVIAEFTCRSAGYGDRTGMMTAQMLTPHEAVITVEQGKVVSAVMDGQWDMMTQTTIQGPSTMPRVDGNNVTPVIPGDGTGNKPQL